MVLKKGAGCSTLDHSLSDCGVSRDRESLTILVSQVDRLKILAKMGDGIAIAVWFGAGHAEQVPSGVV